MGGWTGRDGARVLGLGRSGAREGRASSRGGVEGVAALAVAVAATGTTKTELAGLRQGKAAGAAVVAAKEATVGLLPRFP